MTEPTRTADETGRAILVYDNGAVKDARTGHWISGPTNDDNPIIRDPRGMLALRNEKSKQLTREAIDEGAGIDPSQWGTGEGWRKLIVHTVQTYLQSKNIRGMAEVLVKLGVASGYMSSKETEAPSHGNAITGTPEAWRELMIMLQEEVEARVNKSKAIDGETR